MFGFRTLNKQLCASVFETVLDHNTVTFSKMRPISCARKIGYLSDLYRLFVMIRLLGYSVAAQLSSSPFTEVSDIPVALKFSNVGLFLKNWITLADLKGNYLLYCGAGRRCMLAYWCSNAFKSVDEFQSSRMKLQG